MDFDDLLSHLGDFGLYQRIVYFSACMAAIPVAFHNMGIVFLAAEPDHWCYVPQLDRLRLDSSTVRNLTIPLEEQGGRTSFSHCSIYDRNYTGWTPANINHLLSIGSNNATTKPCPNGWRYDDSVYVSSIVSEWDLVCGDRWLQATSSAIYMAGLMTGTFIFGSLSDIVGRKPVFCISFVLMYIFSVSVAFANTFVAFCALRFILGMTTIGFYTTGFVIAMEFVGQSWRVHAGILLQQFWAAGYMLCAVLANGIRDWRTLQLTLSVPCVMFVLLFFIVPESPRWLYTHGRTREANEVVEHMAKTNNVELPRDLTVTIQADKKGYIWDLVRTPRMRSRSINLFFNWFVNSLVYYGLSLNTSNLGGNDFINFFVAGAVEVPSLVLTQFAVVYLGRRWPLAVTLITAGVALLCTLAVPDDMETVTIVLAMVGKACVTGSFAIIYVFTAELNPTVVRSIGVGTGSFWARVGGVVAPYVAQLSTFHKYIPLAIFGAFSIAAGGLALLLPETKGQKLPDTIEDAESFGRKNSPRDQRAKKTPLTHMLGGETPGYAVTQDAII